MDYPFLSIIIPVYNSEKVIGECLEKIVEQEYEKDKYEVIISDAGSKDKTLDIVNSFRNKINITIIENKLKTGEAGKSIGVENAKGEILAFIDSDNIILDKKFLKKMVEPFLKEPDIIGTEPMYFFYREKDKPLTKYFALAGINDPVCLYIGNYDRFSYLTNKWTGFNLNFVDKGKYILIELDENKIPTIGANGTFIRKEYILSGDYKPYLFDIDIIYENVKKGKNKFVKVKTGIVHIYATNLKEFIKKQQRRIQDFLFFSYKNKRQYPWGNLIKIGILKFSFYSILIFPLFLQSLIGVLRKKTWVWIYHPIVCEITFIIYSFNFIKSKLLRNINMKDRKNW